MKKRALRKDFHVEVKKSMNRFLSILFIVALGVAFFSGIQASAPDMRATGDWYFDENQLMDVRLISTLGITEDDLESIRNISGVSQIDGCYMEDVYCGESDSTQVIHVESLPEHMNQVAIEEGRVPNQSGECFLDSSYASKQGYQIGDTLEMTVSSEEDTMLKKTSYIISGIGHSPTYVSFSRGNTTLGTGSLSGFVYILPEDFDSEVYTVAYIAVEGAREKMSFTRPYDDLVEDVIERIEDIADSRCEIRYNSVMEEAQSELDEADQEVRDGKQKLEDAKQELEDGKAEAESELEEAREELNDGERQMLAGEAKLYEAQLEIESGESEIADGESEIAENEETIADGKQQLAEGLETLESGERAYEEGKAKFDKEAGPAREKLENAQLQIDNGRTELEAGRQEYESSKAQLESGESELIAGESELQERQDEYDAGAAQFQAGKAQYETAVSEYNESKAAYDTGYAQVQAGYAQYHAVIDPLQTAYDTAESEWNDSNTAIDENRTAWSDENSNLTTANHTLTDLQGELGSLNQEYSNQQGIYDGLQASLTAAQNRVAAAQDALDQVDESDEEALAAAQAELTAAQAEESSAQDALTTQESVLTAARTAAEQKQSEVDAQQQLVDSLDSKVTSLNDTYNNVLLPEQEAKTVAKTQANAVLQQTITSLSSTKAMLDQKAGELQAAKGQLDTASQVLTATKTELDTTESELDAAAAQLSAGWTKIQTSHEEIVLGWNELTAGKQTLDASELELDAAQQEVDSGVKELDSAQAQLIASRKELDLGWAEYQASQAKLIEGERQLNSAKDQIEEAKGILAEGVQEIIDGNAELGSSRKKIFDGWDSYEEGKLEAEEKIADGEQKIADADEDLKEAEEEISDARQKLADLKYPDWYVDDRSALPENSSFGENADRLSNIAKVVPILFFLVAALISLTTMTRMVEEERTQIGTLKALGYSKVDIASKYLKYAFWATIGGCIIGVLIGEKIFPWVIITAYGMMFQYLPRLVMPYNWTFAGIATIAAMFCTIGATLSACYRELLAVPAQLMRPPAPKEGKRVWLERIPFLWSHLTFSWKSTVRNLIRYKKRFLMTIIGIGGCMGLLMVGYGLQDSIMDIGILQYQDLQMYDAMVILDKDAPKEEQQEPYEILEQEPLVTAYKQLYIQQMEVQTKGISNKKWNINIFVPKDLENLDLFLNFRSRTTKEASELTDTGAIITEKIAKELGYQPGDVIVLKQDEGDDVEIPIIAVCENYFSHYLYMTPALYEKVFGETVPFNSFLMNCDGDQKQIETIGSHLLDRDVVLNITYTSTLEKQISNMLGAMDVVMIVLIVSAGMLAFVVLYNLNNININERRRELATLKVLGFFDGEVAAYVYRENILLTLIGAMLGVVLGKFLHMYIITTVEVDACMFGRNINFDSYVYGILFTVGFSVLVNLAMYFKLKKIDMVESLKSIE